MAPKPKIYVFSGLSGAGKDTVARLMNLKVIKFAEPGKRALETILGVPEGFLDNRLARKAIAPDCQGRTYLQVLVDFWKYRDLVIGKDLFPQAVNRKILYNLGLGLDIGITDMRSREEMRILCDFNYMGYKVIPTWVIGGECLESDVNSRSLLAELCNGCGYSSPYFIDNSEQKGEQDLLERLNQVYLLP